MIVATIYPGHSEYDDRLWALLGGWELLDAPDVVFTGLDCFELIPYMLLAGATVIAAPASELPGWRLEVRDGDHGAFLAELSRVLERSELARRR